MAQPAFIESAKYCSIKAELLRAYQNATLTYSSAVLALDLTRTGDYESLIRVAEDAELKAAAARQQLEKHLADHGC